jgi:hypothetical protein
MKLDPIIAVKDVEYSGTWYCKVFDLQKIHGGNEFHVLAENGETVICLHKWGEHQHPSMLNENIPSGNGLILYFKCKDIYKIEKNIEALKWPLEESIHLNPNSNKTEFSFRDPDGYYLTVTEYHNYEG